MYVASYSAQTIKKLPPNPRSANPTEYYTYFIRQKILDLVYGTIARNKNDVRKAINYDIKDLRKDYEHQRKIILSSLVADLDATIAQKKTVSKLLLHNLIYSKIQSITSMKNIEKINNKFTDSGLTTEGIQNVECRAFVADIFKNCWSPSWGRLCT